MNQNLQLFILQMLVAIPLVGYVGSLFFKPKHEKGIATWTVTTVATHAFLLLVFLVPWLMAGHPVINQKEIVVFRSAEYEFFIDFYFDKVSAVYLSVGAVVSTLIVLYSKVYMHRESGYKRFFSTVLFFYFGYSLAVLAGNLETLFIGWEILGISSFLLIAFYRDRYLPVKNAVKVFSVYRITDVGLILAMWASHHLWHENISFLKLNNYSMVHEFLSEHSWMGLFISLMIFISAAAKSAQFPFSTWLPRAMEGPTPSSAIFYGALSVHLGVFLMLRTFPFWEHQHIARILIGILGLFTSIMASGVARVQSSVKSQIAYSSIAQIGLIFIEISFGWLDMALVHFAGNAFLRTYQLLVSPSVVSYLIREQFYNFTPRKQTVEDSLPKRLEYTFYMLCLKEWNLDSFMYRYLWNPMKGIGRRLDFLSIRVVSLVLLSVYIVGAALLVIREELPEYTHHVLPALFAFIAVVSVLKSFTERKNVMLSWGLIIMNHFWIALAVMYNETFKLEETFFYLIGIVVAGIVGFLCLRKIKSIEDSINLDRFHGHSYAHPRIAFVFLLACLGATGFPITPTFIGEDLIFSHIHEDQYLLAFFTSISFIVDGLAIIRIYARVFMGPHVNSQFEMAYRSS
jgi:NADH:ubiquinone oxidoreductase subunit 5 (subunit L)/multisubunit Na+/H+ antiporter MnhA subunit